jgi:hypothetical protein
LSEAESSLALQLRARGLTGFVREYRFHPERRWRPDCAHPQLRIGAEIHGGIWSRGRHVRGSGISGRSCCRPHQVLEEVGKAPVQCHRSIAGHDPPTQQHGRVEFLEITHEAASWCARAIRECAAPAAFV